MKFSLRYRNHCIILLLLVFNLHNVTVSGWILSSRTTTRPIMSPSTYYYDQHHHPQQQQQSQYQTRRSHVDNKIDPNSNTSSSSSILSMKIRAMASFVCLTMMEPLIEAGIPIEQILSTNTKTSGTSSKSTDTKLHDVDVITTPTTYISSIDTEIPSIQHNKEGDRTMTLQDEFSPSTITTISDSTSSELWNREIHTSLHGKEGDRNIGLNDEFTPDTDISPTIPTTTNTKDVVSPNDILPSDDVISISDSNNEQSNDVRVEHQIPLTDSNNNDDDVVALHYIPPVPSVISKAFGRPLPIIQEHVPSIQQPPPPLTQVVESNNTTATAPINDTENHVAVVVDEDPYGE